MSLRQSPGLECMPSTPCVSPSMTRTWPMMSRASLLKVTCMRTHLALFNVHLPGAKYSASLEQVKQIDTDTKQNKNKKTHLVA